MPIYEYECEQCGKIEEAFQKISDSPLSACSDCSGKLHKLISRNSFHLKGSGWYVTDYAGKSASQTGDAPKKEDASDKKSRNSGKEHRQYFLTPCPENQPFQGNFRLVPYSSIKEE